MHRPDFLRLNYLQVRDLTAKQAYTDYLKDSLYTLLTELGQQAQQHPTVFQQDEADAMQAVMSAVSSWSGHTVRLPPPLAAKPTEDNAYEVTVRFIVTLPTVFLDTFNPPEGWEVYDVRTEGEDTTLRASQEVRVVAATADEARAQAQDIELPDMALWSEECDVVIWIDEKEEDTRQLN